MLKLLRGLLGECYIGSYELWVDPNLHALPLLLSKLFLLSLFLGAEILLRIRIDLVDLLLRGL